MNQYINIKSSSGQAGNIVNGHTVKFIDYDGTFIKDVHVAHGGSVLESEFPSNPDGDDIRIFSRWVGETTNITQDTVVGAGYWFGSELRSFVFITLDNISGLTIIFRMHVASGALRIYFGDGSNATTSGTGDISITHTYAAVGDYKVIVDGLVNNGNSYLGTSSYSFINIPRVVRKVYMGSPFGLRQYSFKDSVNLSAVCLSFVGFYASGTTPLGGFQGCYSLKGIVVPSSYALYTIMYAFYQCYALKYFIMPSTTFVEGSPVHYFFMYCTSLEYVKLPEGVPGTAYAMFERSTLASIKLPSTVEYLNDEAFYGDYSLEKVDLNEGLLSIGSTAFYSCYLLEILDVPSTVTSIGTNVISYCYRLKSLVLRPVTPPSIAASAGISPRANLGVDVKIYVPDASLNAYRSATGWSIYADIIHPLSEYTE